MTTFHNFRKILQIDPASELYCIANSRNGTRCKVARYWIGAKNLQQAGRILDKMDCIESIDDCRHELGKLVKVMVCGSPHRTHQGALDECVGRWNQVIDDYVALKKSEEVELDLGLTLCMTEDVVFGSGRNEGLQIALVGTALQSPQIPAFDSFDSIPILTTASSEHSIPVSVNAPPHPEPMLEAPMANHQLARNEPATLPDELLPDLNSKDRSGAGYQHQQQLGSSDSYGNSPQQEDKGSVGYSETEILPTSPNRDHVHILPRLDIEATDLAVKDEVSPPESDYKPEEAVLEVSPPLSISGSVKNEAELHDDYLSTFSSENDPDLASTVPDILIDSEGLVRKSEVLNQSILRSDNNGSETYQDGQSLTISAPPASHELNFSPEEASIPSSLEDLTSASSRSDVDAPTPETEMSSTNEDRQESQPSRSPTKLEGYSMRPNIIDNSSIIPTAREEPNRGHTNSARHVTLDEIDIFAVTRHSDIVVEERRTRSTSKKLLQVRPDHDHLSPIPNESYGTGTVYPTERRSSQRFHEHRTPSEPDPALHPFIVNFDHREALAPLATNKKIILKSEPVIQARRPSIIETVVKDEIQWENYRGAMEKKKGLRMSLQGAVQKVWTKGKRGLRSSGD